MKVRISVGITIRIIKGGRITTGIICIKKMGITVIIKIGFTIAISITIRITILKRTITSGFTVVGNGADRHMDGPITCSSLTLQGDENHRKNIFL
jgi:hypothetical protein